MPKKGGGVKGKTAAPAVDLYRRVVVSFVVLTAVLILVVLYFSFVSVKITITPKPEKVLADFTVTVTEAPDGLVEDQLNGVFFNQEVAGEQEFIATGSRLVASDVVGRVTIINDYRRPQPLVATTRLLSPDNVLLRTKQRVDVPAGGRVEVEVYADDPSQLADRTLPAGTRLTVINLAPTLQDKIYGQTAGVIQIGANTVPVVTAEDLQSAKAKLLQQLQEKTLADLGVDGRVATVVAAVEKQATTTALVGEEKAKFTVKTKATIQGVLFDKESVIRLAESRMRNSLSADKEMANIDYESLRYEIDKMDLSQKTATVRIYLEGVAVLRLNSQILAKDNFKGLKRAEAEKYFAQQPLVEKAELKFFPFWIRRVPQLADHIEIVVK